MEYKDESKEELKKDLKLEIDDKELRLEQIKKTNIIFEKTRKKFEKKEKDETKDEER